MLKNDHRLVVTGI